MSIIGDWINRQRHNKGYGIQSPSEFFFVTQVLKERLPYYAYTVLETIAAEENRSGRYLKELFRIANHHNPANCIAVHSATAACAMSTARPSVDKFCITDSTTGEKTGKLLTGNNCRILHGDATGLLDTVLKELKEVGMLYIGNCCVYAELLETALRYTKEKSIIVVEGIHRNKDVEKWWNSVIERSEIVVTYDLYSYGLLYFNKERRKQHYTLKR